MNSQTNDTRPAGIPEPTEPDWVPLEDFKDDPFTDAEILQAYEAVPEIQDWVAEIIRPVEDDGSWVVNAGDHWVTVTADHGWQLYRQLASIFIHRLIEVYQHAEKQTRKQETAAERRTRWIAEAPAEYERLNRVATRRVSAMRRAEVRYGGAA